MWIEEVTDELSAIYGAKAGEVARTIIPPCLADFGKMLGKAAPGSRVSEEYKTEDEKALLIFAGEKTEEGRRLISVTVNGKEIAADIRL
ncbi:MAG: hypothetical protein K6G42_09645 [Lachnospiraceae bacterium]|nr:hypothetical protein [Lachnospiraceae bacterium]